MKKIKKLKYMMLLIAFIVLAIVSFCCPEYVENVARAFLLLLGVF
jgi:hypothetical protein